MFSWGGFKRKKHLDPHAALWATLTILAFPIVATCAAIAGLNPIIGFFLGAFASLVVIGTEGLAKGRVWIADPAITAWLGHPSSMFRLFSMVGVVMLVFETYLIAGFIASPIFDRNIVNFSLNRSCNQTGANWAGDYCIARSEILARNISLDPISAAMRQEAAKRFFPSASLVTCAVRPLAFQKDTATALRVALVRCDSWIVDPTTKDLVSTQSAEGLVAAKFHLLDDGTYSVFDWSSDPSASDWPRIAGLYGTGAVRLLSSFNINDVRQRLANESRTRALQELSRH
ncbi:MAG: hypothetical protein WC477_01555 [Patescibacteria group bacterium]